MREEIVTPPSESSLPFRVRMSGVSYCDGSYHMQRTNSNLTLLEYVVRGKGTVTEEDNSFVAKEGDIYILHEGRNHNYYSDAQDPWVKIWMNLSGPAVEHLVYAYGLEQVNHVSGLDLKDDFQNFYEQAKSCKTATETADRCSLLFHEILQKIAKHLRNQGGKNSSLAKTVKEIIDSTTGFDVTLEELSSRLFFTKAHIIRVFRNEYQVTPYEYILSRKLRLAKDLLNNTTLSVSEIAVYLNFCDAHYFTNFFRGRTGKTPREYRNRNQE